MCDVKAFKYYYSFRKAKFIHQIKYLILHPTLKCFFTFNTLDRTSLNDVLTFQVTLEKAPNQILHRSVT